MTSTSSKAASSKKTHAQSGSPSSSVVPEGQQVTRDETTACGAASRPGTVGNGLNTRALEVGGGIEQELLCFAFFSARARVQQQRQPVYPLSTVPCLMASQHLSRGGGSTDKQSMIAPAANLPGPSVHPRSAKPEQYLRMGRILETLTSKTS